MLTVEIWRGNATGGAFANYDVPMLDNQTVLDVVAWVQQHTDETLSYRYACRVGMCGSCAMMVNGIPRWTCRTHTSRVVDDADIKATLRVEPLRNLPVIKDLAVDMDPFFDKWVAAEGVFHPSGTRDDAIPVLDPSSASRRAADAGIECINCAVCYAACDVVAANDSYLGPAALNRAWTLVQDAKDDARATILDAVSGIGGCHNCHSQGSCARYCPNELNPTAAIAGLKRETARGWLARLA